MEAIRILKALFRKAVYSERYIYSLASNYLATATSILAQFMLVPLYLNHLGEAQFGLLMMLLSTVNLAAIGITWMSGGLVRIFGEYWSKRCLSEMCVAYSAGKYIFTSYALLVSLLGISGYASYCLLSSISLESLPYIILGGLYLVFNYESIPDKQVLIATDRQSAVNAVEVYKTTTFALTTLLLMPEYKDISIVFIALISSTIQARFILGYMVRREYRLRLKWPSREMLLSTKRLLGYHGRLYVIYGAMLLVSQADAIFVGLLGGPVLAGQYVLLMKVPEAIALFLWRVPSTLEPRIIAMDSTNRLSELRSLYRAGLMRFIGLTTGIFFLYAIFGRYILKAWLGYSPFSNMYIFFTAAVAVCLTTITRWPVSFAYATQKLGPLCRVASIELLIKLLFLCILLPHFGILAPAVATSISAVIYSCRAYQRLVPNATSSLA